MKRSYKKVVNPIYQPNDLLDYMFTEENIQKLVTNIKTYQTPSREKKETKKKITSSSLPLSDFILPKYDDKLFWCWIIFFYGISDYEFTQNQNWQRESIEKIKMVEDIRKYKSLLKPLKLKKRKLEEELTSLTEISLDIIIILCAIHNFNLIFIKGKMFYKYEDDKPKNTLIIQDRGDGAQIYIGDSINQYETKCHNLWRIYDLKKPLKSLTSYKLKELQHISKILDLPIHNSNGKKKTKKVLYQQILGKI